MAIVYATLCSFYLYVKPFKFFEEGHQHNLLSIKQAYMEETPP